MKIYRHQDIPDQGCEEVCSTFVWVGLGQNIIIVLAGILTIVIVYIFRRRSELFFIVTPLLFAISCALGLTQAIAQLYQWYPLDDRESNLSLAFDGCAQSLDLMAHWIFSAQYLKTSLVLPKLFT